MPSEIIQWFPGHMAKTRRMITENLKLVDVVFELLDARIPYSSQNPEIPKLTAIKPRLTLLSKSSLADPKVTAMWQEYYQKSGRKCIFYDVRTGEGLEKIQPAVNELCAEKLARYKEKGMVRPLKAMIVGIPNVGKSSLINRIALDKKAKVEDRPGVTKDMQWVRTSYGIDLMDMPGVLWPKFEERTVGENLAMTGAVKDEITELESLACQLCKKLYELYPDLLCQRYKLEKDELTDLESWEIFELIGKRRGFLISRGEVNYDRTSRMLLDEFRAGKIGRITLEVPGGKHA